ncbi:MAG: cytochrome c biogenesis protein CcsA [Acidilobaceae archaeon]
MTTFSSSIPRALLYGMILLALVDAFTLIYGVSKGAFPSYVDRGSPTAYKNMYVHIQLGWATYLFFTIAFVAAILYLIRRDARMERIAHVSITIGWLYGAVTWITGTLWSVESWGTWWSWDPRQTSILFLLIAYIVYYIIRSSVKDPDVATRVSMAYAVAAYVTIPLSFVLPQVVEALHPTPRETFRAGSFSIAYMLLRAVIVLTLGALLARTLYLRVTKGIEVPKLILVVPAFVLIAAILSSLPIVMGFMTEAATELREGANVRFFGTVIHAELLKLDESTKTYELKLKVLSGDREVPVEYNGKFVIDPPQVEIRRGETTNWAVTLLGHYVVIEGVVTGGEVIASSIEVVTAWCVAASALLYALTLLAIVILIFRGL